MSAIPLPFTGGCVCGAVRYECTAEPRKIKKSKIKNLKLKDSLARPYVSRYLRPSGRGPG